MLKFRLFTIISVILFTGFVNISYAPEPLKFAVHVSVTCDDPSVKATIESHIKRELRSLQDVLLVSPLAENYTYIYDISVVALKGTYRVSGRETGGIAVGYQFNRRFNCSYVKNHLMSKESWNAIGELRHNMSLFTNHGVITDDTRDLPVACKRLIVSFDTVELEPIRKMDRQQATLYGNP